MIEVQLNRNKYFKKLPTNFSIFLQNVVNVKCDGNVMCAKVKRRSRPRLDLNNLQYWQQRRRVRPRFKQHPIQSVIQPNPIPLRLKRGENEKLLQRPNSKENSRRTDY